MFNLAGEGRRRRRVDFVDKVGGQGGLGVQKILQEIIF